MGFLIQQFTLNYEKEKSSTYKSSHQDNMKKRELCVYALESTNNDIHSFHSVCNNGEHVLLGMLVFFLLLLAALAWNSFDTSIGIGIHLVNFILCLFVTRQSQNINTDNIRLLYFFLFGFCSLSLDYQNVVNCTVYDKWYILNVYNRKTPKG